jgi:mannose-1-phosphate guanylyltransferase
LIAENTSASSSSGSRPLAWSWNAGMFVFRISTVEKALQQYRPDIYSVFQKICLAPTPEEQDAAFLSLKSKIPHPLSPTTSVDCSIDYAVMMPLTLDTAPTTLSAAVIPGSFPWWDVGGFSAFKTVPAIPQDAQGNIKFGTATCDPATARSIIVAEIDQAKTKDGRQQNSVKTVGLQVSPLPLSAPSQP